MGKLPILAALAFLVSTLPFSSAHAQIWQTSKILKKGAASVGGFGQYYFDPSEFMAYGQLAYGIGNDFQLEGRLGVGSLDFYAGMFAKSHLVSNKLVSISLWSGLHSQGNAFWDLAPIFSHDFGAVDLYFAPFISISLGDRSSGVTLNPGLSVALRPGISLYAELALKVSHIPSSLIGGVRYFF